MTKEEFYRFIEKGTLQGACRYFEYWFCYRNTPEHARVLEIGAGTSALAQAIQSIRYTRVYITDIDKKAVDYQLKHKILSELTSNLDSFGDEMFDLVINASSIEHFDPQSDGDIKMIEQVKRVLKPGGLFINTLPTGSKYIKSRGTPPEKIYSELEFKLRFLPGFRVIKKKFYTDSFDQPFDFVPHSGWRVPNFKEAFTFGDNVGLCVVLKKI